MTLRIEKRLTVPLAPRDTFDLFTAGIDRWWPKDSHSLSASAGLPARRVTVEPRLGGRILEEAHDGATHPWGTITEWCPGEALAFDWYVGHPRAEATQVRVTFLPHEGGTRVDLVHSGFEARGAEAAEACRRYRTGWDLVLGRCYGGACAAVA